MNVVTRFLGISVALGFLTSSVGAAPYTFVAGYSVMDEANSPGIGTNYGSTIGLKYGSFGADLVNGTVYFTRDYESTSDGHTNLLQGLVATISLTNSFNGGNYTDTGLLGAETNSQPLTGSHGIVAIDSAKNRILVYGDGTNLADFRGTLYSAPIGTIGGSPAGGNPSVANSALSNLFQVPDDLPNTTGSSSRAGFPLGMAARTAGGVTTVFLAQGNHAEAWSDDATNGAPQFPWRRLWASYRAPRQNKVAETNGTAMRLVGTDRVLNGITVDDEGNCYFSIQFTDPPRIWRVPANAAQVATAPWNLDFDDRALGGTNGSPNAIITPVITRLPAPAMLFSGTNSFVNPQHVTFFRTDGKPGLFVSSFFWMNGAGAPPFTPYRSVVRVVLDPMTVTSGGFPNQPASVVDAFGTSATPGSGDTILDTLQSSRSGGMSPAFGLTQPMKLFVMERMCTQVNSITNPSTLYLQAFVTDTNRGQTIPTAALVKATIPPLPPAPALVSLTPSSGLTNGGTVVELSGSNFVSGATVKFNGGAASVTFSNSTLLVATTPARAAGTVTVTVQNPDGQIGALSNSFTYVIPPAPGIASVLPNSGPTAGGTLVTITGSNFVSGMTVTFGGNSASSVNFSNSTLVTAMTPGSAAGTVNVSVQNPDTQNATVVNAFTFIAPPGIATVLPNTGLVSGGTLVTITGSNFINGLVVRFGASAASVNFSNATLVTAVTPAHAAGVVDVTVENPDLQTATASNAFTFVLPAPAITIVTPASGPEPGGTLVEITGSNFVSGATVQFGGNNATSVNFSNSTLITAVTPAHAAGAVNVTIQNPDSQSAVAFNAFTFISPPTIVSITPTNGPDAGGTLVTITGSNFVSGATVSFGGNSATLVNFSNSTLITVVTPANAAGAANVAIQNPDSQSAVAFNAFTFIAPPTMVSLTPTNGPDAGGTLVEITGSNFVSGLTVKFGNSNAVSVNFSNSTLITAITPAHPAGTVNVGVQNPDLQMSTAVNAFAFVAPPLSDFAITSISLLLPDSIELIWSASSNSVYAVEFRDDLFATNWSSLGSVTAATASVTFTNLGGATNIERYYRVGRLP